MRHLSIKYQQAYTSLLAPNGQVPETSRLKMSPRGSRPQNPFVELHAFESSLSAQTYMRPEHQGRFTASHANPCLGKMIEYQRQRQGRTYVIGLHQRPEPNDYVNMFFEELKLWALEHLTRQEVAVDELQKRATYLSKVKQDRYHWVFPNETDLYEHKLHDVIDFVHERVLEVLQIVRTEQRNQSMYSLMKRMNDHTLNCFNYGRAFLTFLLFADKQAGADLLAASRELDQSTYARGKLAGLLSATSASVLRIADETQASERPDSETSLYEVQVPRVIPATFLRNAGFVVSVTGPRAGGSFETWEVVQTQSDFDALSLTLREHLGSATAPRIDGRRSSRGGGSESEEERQALERFLRTTLQMQSALPEPVQARLAVFLDVGRSGRDLARMKRGAVVSEENPNVFAVLKRTLDAAAPRGSPVQSRSLHARHGSGLPPDLRALQEEWGWEHASDVLQAFSLLQRLCTMLSWTYEINSIFVAMFGNTLSFSKIPLKEMLDTQRVIVMQLLSVCRSLYDGACQLNRQRGYKWHRNLDPTDTNLRFFVHHANHLVDCVGKIEREHLDYGAQAKRLKEVMSRFGPLITRIDTHLPSIRRELGISRPRPSQRTQSAAAEEKDTEGPTAATIGLCFERGSKSSMPRPLSPPPTVH